MSLRQQFRHSIKCGTGRAYLILRDHPAIDFSKEITQAALTNDAYDAQSEGDRAAYVARLIDLSDQKENIVDCILQALMTEQQDGWALDQLFELAKGFAQQGNQRARQAIYERYHQKVIDGFSWCGQDAIIELDGMEGLKYVAEMRGKALRSNPQDWEDSFLVDSFQQDNPNINVYDELNHVSTTNPYTKFYMETIREHKWSRQQRKKIVKFNYDFVKENIENNKRIPISPRGIKELSDIDIQRLADDFLQEKNIERKEKYLHIFSKAKFRLSKNAVFWPNSLPSFWRRSYHIGMPKIAGFWAGYGGPKWARRWAVLDGLG